MDSNDITRKQAERLTRPEFTPATPADHWSIDLIAEANKAAGQFWFEPSSKRFFRSRVARAIYQGPGGIFFVSSEQFIGSQGAQARRYTVRQFMPETGSVNTAGKFNEQTRAQAVAAAKLAAKGGQS